MKINVLSFYSKILSFILLVLGFSSCGNDDSIDGGDMRLEYGTPTAKYKIKGVVKSSETKKDVRDIKIVAVRKINDQVSDMSQPVSSQADGSFTLEIYSFPDKNLDFEVKFEDVDGEANGGLFDTKIEKVNFKDAVFINGDGKWNRGETEKDIKTVEINPAKKN